MNCMFGFSRWKWIVMHEMENAKFSSCEIFVLSGRYTAYIGSHLPTFRQNISVPYARIKQS